MNATPTTALDPASLAAITFPATSRYHGLEIKTTPLSDGRTVSYVARRFVPSPDRFVTLREHTVTQGERIDNIAYQYLGDPEQFWRLCDANGVLSANELTDQPGTRIRITLPEGIPGGSDG